jgi:hypothetical protein
LQRSATFVRVGVRLREAQVEHADSIRQSSATGVASFEVGFGVGPLAGGEAAVQVRGENVLARMLRLFDLPAVVVFAHAVVRFHR